MSITEIRISTTVTLATASNPLLALRVVEVSALAQFDKNAGKRGGDYTPEEGQIYAYVVTGEIDNERYEFLVFSTRVHTYKMLIHDNIEPL